MWRAFRKAIAAASHFSRSVSESHEFDLWVEFRQFLGNEKIIINLWY